MQEEQLPPPSLAWQYMTELIEHQEECVDTLEEKDAKILKLALDLVALARTAESASYGQEALAIAAILATPYAGQP